MSPLEQAYDEQSVELRGYLAVNNELTERLTHIEACQQLQSMQEAERKAHRTAQYNKRKSMDSELFIKVFPKGVCDMKELKDVKNISFSDAGKLMFISMHIQKDTGLVANPNGSAMNVTQMSKAIGDSRQNLHKTLKLFLEMNFMRVVNGEYFVNPDYAFNGINRSKVVQLVFNNCTIGDNATFIIDQSTIDKMS